MLELESVQPHSQARLESGDSKRPVFAQHPPRLNRILAALTPKDYVRLLPDLEPVALPLGSFIYRAGDLERNLYFLTAGVAARFYLTRNGASAEFSLAGNEGVIGIASFLGGESTPSQTLMLGTGHAYRLGRRALRREFMCDSQLANLLLRYTHRLIAQTMRSGACNRHHSVEQQLCRWLLSCVDRVHSSELTMTQEGIAQMLGVRRESVTQVAAKLQNAGLIHTSRGRIGVLDRAQLEARSCECYAADRREYEHFLAGSLQSRVAA